MNNLIRFTPGADLRRMQREFDRLFDTVSAGRSDVEGGVWAPRTDLIETDAAYLIRLDLPGVPRENINLNLHENALTISGERKAVDLSETDSIIHSERAFGPFHRTFRLPKTAREDGITASYRDGVLAIRVPKAEETRPRRIDVQ